jgi:hypothetical protein
MQTRVRLIAVMFAFAVLLVGSASVLAQDISCSVCHDETTLITGKQTSLSLAVHGTGTAFDYAGSRASCSACHSGGAFSAMVTQGLTPDTVTVGDPNPTQQDCRTCHQIHVTNTEADWALETTAPVPLFAFENVTFDGGKGNLCANCHQPRRVIAAADPNDSIAVTSTHWGPHHGPQSAMMLGIGGAGDVTGKESFHSRMVADTCVTCHIGPEMVHTFEAITSGCEECHGEEFDIDSKQAEVEELIVQLHDLLEAKGLYHDGHPVVGIYPSAEASALWNYIFIAIEDGSLGVHNPDYTKDLLNASIAALQ